MPDLSDILDGDQEDAGMAHIARVLWQFYAACLKEGFGEEQAFELTVNMQFALTEGDE